MADFGIGESIALASLLAGAAGTAVSVAGQAQQAQQQAATANYQRQVAPRAR